jgi:FtsZ-binding cell division protein ZapB
MDVMSLLKRKKLPMNETLIDGINQSASQQVSPLRMVRCGMEVCPTCAQVRENEAGEIRELRLKLSQMEEAFARQEDSCDACSATNDVLQGTVSELQRNNKILLNDVNRLRIERDKAIQSAAYLKAQYEALQNHLM